MDCEKNISRNYGRGRPKNGVSASSSNVSYSKSAADSSDSDYDESSKPVKAVKLNRRAYVKRACQHCRKLHLSCDTSRPCRRCAKAGIECIDEPTEVEQTFFHRKRSLDDIQNLDDVVMEDDASLDVTNSMEISETSEAQPNPQEPLFLANTKRRMVSMTPPPVSPQSSPSYLFSTIHGHSIDEDQILKQLQLSPSDIIDLYSHNKSHPQVPKSRPTSLTGASNQNFLPTSSSFSDGSNNGINIIGGHKKRSSDSPFNSVIQVTPSPDTFKAVDPWNRRDVRQTHNDEMVDVPNDSNQHHLQQSQTNINNSTSMNSPQPIDEYQTLPPPHFRRLSAATFSSDQKMMKITVTASPTLMTSKSVVGTQQQKKNHAFNGIMDNPPPTPTGSNNAHNIIDSSPLQLRSRTPPTSSSPTLSSETMTKTTVNHNIYENVLRGIDDLIKIRNQDFVSSSITEDTNTVGKSHTNMKSTVNASFANPYFDEDE